MSFTSTIDKLNNRINELEEKIDNLNKKSITENNTGISIYTQSSLNYKILNQKIINIKKLENNKHQIFIQLKISFYNYFQQEIQFKLFADKILINQTANIFSVGKNEVVLSGSYFNPLSDKINIQAQINNKDNREVVVNDTTLTIWGQQQVINEEYHAIELSNKYCLSYLTNNQVFYKLFNKNTECESVDFVLFETALSHDICAFEDKLYIFTVDEDGNLFFYNFDDENELFISANVNKVSCCNIQDKIIYSYISNNKVYYGEIINNTIISNNKLTYPTGNFISSYLHHNKFNDKCYLLLTKKDLSNYLLENINDQFSSSENIYANISLNISSF